MPKQVVLTGVVIHPEGSTYRKQIFDQDYPYSYCRICGWLYQPAFQRRPVPPKQQLPNSPHDSLEKQKRRARACQGHELTHTQIQRDYVKDGKFTPEAAHKLAPFGIYNLTSSALVPDVKQAMAEAPRSSELISN